VGEILQEAQKIARAVEGKDVMLRVAPEVAKMLKSNQNTYLQEIEEVLGRTVIVKSDPQLHQEKFDLA
jgi:ribonuclease G